MIDKNLGQRDGLDSFRDGRANGMMMQDVLLVAMGPVIPHGMGHSGQFGMGLLGVDFGNKAEVLQPALDHEDLIAGGVAHERAFGKLVYYALGH